MVKYDQGRRRKALEEPLFIGAEAYTPFGSGRIEGCTRDYLRDGPLYKNSRSVHRMAIHEATLENIRKKTLYLDSLFMCTELSNLFPLVWRLFGASSLSKYL